MPLINRIRRHWLFSLMFVSLAAWAGTSYADYLRALAQRESSMNQYAVNQYGYAGLYQMGKAALQDAGYKNSSGAWTGKDGVTSQAAFLADAQAQTNAITTYHQKAWNTIQAYGLDKYVGQTVNGVQITPSGLLAGYHLLGIGNATNPGLQAYLQTGKNPKDPNGTTIASYIAKFGGYSLPVSGTTYASVLAANPSGGATGGTATSTSSNATPLPTSLISGSSVLGSLLSSSPTPNPVHASPLAGYAGGSGSTMGDTRNMLTLVAGTAALLWLAYVVFGSWAAFADGKTGLHVMSQDIVRGALVVMLIVAVLW